MLVVQHLAPSRPSLLVEILRRLTTVPVREAHQADAIRSGEILIAPPGRHISINTDHTVTLTDRPAVHFVRPSADVLFESVAETFGRRAVAVVLSGTGEDGADGVRAIKRHGGTVLVQHDTGASFFDGMPSAAIRTGTVDAVLSIHDMAPAIMALASRLGT